MFKKLGVFGLIAVVAIIVFSLFFVATEYFPIIPPDYSAEPVMVNPDGVWRTEQWATRMPHQRNTWYAAGRFWVSFAGNQARLLTSCPENDRTSWTDVIEVHNYSLGGAGFAVYPEDDYIHYVWSYSVASTEEYQRKVYYGKFLCNSDGTITMQAPEQIVADWTQASGKFPEHTIDDPAIALDSNGYPWICAMVVHNTQYGTGDEKGVIVFKSTTKDGTWNTASGFPVYPLGHRQNYLGQLCPLDDGTMYVVGGTNYMEGGFYNPPHDMITGAVCYSDGTFGSEETICPDPQKSAEFFGQFTSISNGMEVHVAYVEGPEGEKPGHIVDAIRSSGGNWNKHYLIDENVLGPVVTPLLTEGKWVTCIWAGYPEKNTFYTAHWNGISWSEPNEWFKSNVEHNTTSFDFGHSWHTSGWKTRDGIVSVVWRSYDDASPNTPILMHNYITGS